MEILFARHARTSERLAQGALGPYLDCVETFARNYLERGYDPRVVKAYVRVVADFGDWLMVENRPASGLGFEEVEAFLASDCPRVHRRGLASAGVMRTFFQCLVDAGLARLPIPATPEGSELEQLLSVFSEYLSQERGLSAATLRTYLPLTHRFLLDCFGAGSVQLSSLRASDVSSYVLRFARRFSPSRAKSLVTTLRVFFHFLRRQGQLELDLSACVPTVPDWRLTTLPKSLESEQVELLLKSCNTSSATGRRDKAILLLLARLGLRGGEVASLELDDIDWEAGEVTICGKGQQVRRLPLPVEVGEAIAAYLQLGRPRCKTRRVFIGARAPHREFSGAGTIGDIVGQALARAGLNPPRKGAHLLRHSAAVQMLRRGGSLEEIGQLLGHRRPDTTAIYAKVDLDALRMVTQAWPGGAA